MTFVRATFVLTSLLALVLVLGCNSAAHQRPNKTAVVSIVSGYHTGKCSKAATLAFDRFVQRLRRIDLSSAKRMCACMPQTYDHLIHTESSEQNVVVARLKQPLYLRIAGHAKNALRGKPVSTLVLVGNRYARNHAILFAGIYGRWGTEPPRVWYVGTELDGAPLHIDERECGV